MGEREGGGGRGRGFVKSRGGAELICCVFVNLIRLSKNEIA